MKKKNCGILLNVDEDMKRELVQAAEIKDWTVSYFLRKLLDKELKRMGIRKG